MRRSALGNWTPPAGRPDIVAQIMDSHQGRVERLIPVRVARMAASPYGFLRSAAMVMAEDLGRLPATGIQPVICGEAHLGNFAFYASPEQDLDIDVNDFDEAHPGGWEWDLSPRRERVGSRAVEQPHRAGMQHCGHRAIGHLLPPCSMACAAATTCLNS